MTEKPFGGIDSEEFRKIGKEVVDWMADYLRDAEKYPVFSQVKPGDIKKQLPAAPPALSENMETILSDFRRIILPGITHWNHPGFLAYFAGELLLLRQSWKKLCLTGFGKCSAYQWNFRASS